MKIKLVYGLSYEVHGKGLRFTNPGPAVEVSAAEGARLLKLRVPKFDADNHQIGDAARFELVPDSAEEGDAPKNTSRSSGKSKDATPSSANA